MQTLATITGSAKRARHATTANANCSTTPQYKNHLAGLITGGGGADRTRHATTADANSLKT